MNSPSLDNSPLSEVNASSVEQACVVAVQHKNRQESLVWVEPFERSTCGQCDAAKTCGQGVLSRWFQRKPRCYAVECGMADAALLSVGQVVSIEVPEGTLAKVALLVFMLPLLTLISTAAVADLLGLTDILVFVAAVVGLFAGLWLTRRIEQLPMVGKIAAPRLLLPGQRQVST